MRGVRRSAPAVMVSTVRRFGASFRRVSRRRSVGEEDRRSGVVVWVWGVERWWG